MNAKQSAVGNESGHAPALHHANRGPNSFQHRVAEWTDACFGRKVSFDKAERNARFYEEATELVQACQMSREAAHALVDYVYDRPVGEPHQEVGGTMVTLAALCTANGLEMEFDSERELGRVWEKLEAIRLKHASKPKASPLPAAPTALQRLHPVTGLHLRRFFEAVAEKLLEAEEKYGYADDWSVPDWKDECLAHFAACVSKGDPRDVTAYCMFMWVHGWRTALPPGSKEAREFAASVFRTGWNNGEVGDLEGSDLQQLASDSGLLKAHTLENDLGCGEMCACRFHGAKAGDTCYRPTEAGRELLKD